MKLEFHIEHPGEEGAGIRSYHDKVTILVDSGDPGGEESGEDSFTEFMRRALSEWFDGAGVEMEEERRKPPTLETEYNVCPICDCEYSASWSGCPSCNPNAERIKR